MSACQPLYLCLHSEHRISSLLWEQQNGFLYLLYSNENINNAILILQASDHRRASSEWGWRCGVLLTLSSYQQREALSDYNDFGPATNHGLNNQMSLAYEGRGQKFSDWLTASDSRYALYYQEILYSLILREVLAVNPLMRQLPR